MIEKSLLISLIALGLISAVSALGDNFADTINTVVAAFNIGDCRGVGIWDDCQTLFTHKR